MESTFYNKSLCTYALAVKKVISYVISSFFIASLFSVTRFRHGAYLLNYFIKLPALNISKKNQPAMADKGNRLGRSELY